MRGTSPEVRWHFHALDEAKELPGGAQSETRAWLILFCCCILCSVLLTAEWGSQRAENQFPVSRWSFPGPPTHAWRTFCMVKDRDLCLLHTTCCHKWYLLQIETGLPWRLSGEESTCQCWRHRRHEFRSLGREDPLEKEMATHSSILAWRIPWTEGPWAAVRGRKGSDMTEHILK